jgi:L-alanine-DL-glutamate epimerase-like enolase superfamily enzyme
MGSKAPDSPLVDARLANTASASRGGRITRVSTFPFHVPFAAPVNAGDDYAYEWGVFGTKEGASGVLVKIETDEGLVGWGECSVVFHPYQPVSIFTEAIQSMARYAVGWDVLAPERLVASLYSHAGWHFTRAFANYALAGIEMAMYDCIGKCAGLSLSQCLGGAVRDRVPFMYFLYRDELSRTVSEAKRAVEAGFETLYTKVGVDPPEEDIERLTALRDAVGPRIQIRVDANETWSVAKAVRVIRQLEHLDLEFVEQPVLAQDLEGMATVRSRCRTPIAADQSARTIHQMLEVVRYRAADVVCSDPGSAGGISAARKHAAIAEAAGLPMFIHSNVELGVGTAALVHLAASFVNCTYASQTEYQFVRDADVLVEPLTIAGGSIGVPTAPGLGIDVNEDAAMALAEECARTNGSGVSSADLENAKYLPSR